MEDYTSSRAFEENGEVTENSTGLFDSNENDYSFEGYKIVINQKVRLTPVSAPKNTKV